MEILIGFVAGVAVGYIFRAKIGAKVDKVKQKLD